MATMLTAIKGLEAHEAHGLRSPISRPQSALMSAPSPILSIGSSNSFSLCSGGQYRSST